jgi:hypothetical protein
MQLIIAGSRTFTDYQLLCQTLAPERPRMGVRLILTNFQRHFSEY